MAIKKYLSLERLTEYDALIKAEIAEGDAVVKSYVDTEVAKKADSEHNHTISDVTDLQEALDTINENVGNAVLYTEQELTDEQRTQARQNIAKIQYDWREVVGYGGTYILADYKPYYGEAGCDIDEVISLTSTILPQYSALGCLHGCVRSLVSLKDIESKITTWMPRILSDYKAICDAGLLNGEYFYICGQKSSRDEEIELAYAITPSVSNNGFTHILQVYSDANHCGPGVIYYNENTNEYKISFSAWKYTDDSLTLVDHAADAKAVGEALALKIDKDEIATDDEILEMLTQEDMLPVVADSDGALLADEDSNILLW